MANETIVMVGAGLTSARAVEALREAGDDSRVVMIGSENLPPYERPPLSKDNLQGKRDQPTWALDEAWYGEHDVELRTGQTVTAVDPESREVTVEGGDSVTYDKLLFATGAEPRRIGIPGHELAGVHYLRDADSSNALRDAFADGTARVVVIGAGWIGSEVAASARTMGCPVTVIEPAAVPLERVLGAEIGGFYRDVHIGHGIEYRLGTGVEAFEGDGRVERVRTSDGETIEADLVVVGIGVIPRTGVAEAMGVDCDNGILTDASLRTNLPGVFAAGDVANAFHPFYDRRLRVEHWANATRQGRAAGLALAGKDVSYEEIPYFYSDQYEVGMEYVGYASGEDELVIRGDVGKGEFIAFWLQDDRIAAGMNVNIWDVSDPIRDLIKAKKVVDRADLANPDKDLTTL